MRPTTRLPLRLWIAVALATAGALLAGPVMASDPSAEEWVKLGVQDFKRQDYEAARVSFGHAYSVDPNAAVLLNLALAELQSGHPVDAIRHLRSYLKDPSADPAKVTVVL